MRLPRAGREYYNLEITTDPVLTGWQASFDDGATWFAGSAGTVQVKGAPVTVTQWLVAGPDADLGTAVAQLTGSVQPRIRDTANPEILVRDAPTIIVTA